MNVRSSSVQSLHFLLDELLNRWFRFVPFQEGLQVIGKCGGRCGVCSPESDIGLQIEMVKGKK